MVVTRQQIRVILDDNSELNNFGWGLLGGGRGMTMQRYQAKIKEGQQSLLNELDAINKCVEWLADVAKTKTLNRKRTSYDYKHIVEEDIGYLSNGAFIVAAILAGFTVKRECEDSLNGRVNISERDLQRKRKETQARLQGGEGAE